MGDDDDKESLSTNRIFPAACNRQSLLIQIIGSNSCKADKMTVSMSINWASSFIAFIEDFSLEKASSMEL